MPNHPKEQQDPRLFKPYLVSLLLLCADLIVIGISFGLAYLTRLLLIPLIGGTLTPKMAWPVFWIFSLVFLFQAWLNGLYPGFGRTGLYEFRTLFRVVGISAVFAGVIIYFLDLTFDVSRIVFLLTGFNTFLLLPAFRLFTYRRGSRIGWWGKPVLLYGSKDDAESMIRYLRSSHRIALIPQAVVLTTGVESEILGVPVHPDSQDQWQAFQTRGYTHVITFENSSDKDNFPRNTLSVLSEFFPTVDLVLSDPLVSAFSIRIGELNGAPALHNEYQLLRPEILFLKRIFDILFSLFTLVITFPLFLVISIAIVLESGTPVLFSQYRLGKQAKPFRIYKFRTMKHDAEDSLFDILKKDESARREYELHHKLSNDPRLTGVGKFIRKFGLDELPQVINVLRGEMSWVGPRAYMPGELERIGDCKSLIFRTNPGLTGWWQVNGRNKLTFEQRLIMDRYYISNFSPLLDAFIIYKTVFVLLEAKGL